MTIKEMHSWFDILQMKGINMEFTSREKDHIINRAQIKYVNEILQTKFLPSLKKDERSELVYSPTESNVSGYENIQPLLGLVVVSANSGGAIFFNQIETEMDANLFAIGYKDAGYSGSKLMTILSVARKDSNLPLRYIHGTDRYKNHKNIYRKPSNHDPVYQIETNHINIDPNFPTGTTVDHVIHYVREPEPVKLNEVNCELPDFTHDEIMAIALDDAGVATRDSALMQLNKANKDNLSETF